MKSLLESGIAGNSWNRRLRVAVCPDNRKEKDHGKIGAMQ